MIPALHGGLLVLGEQILGALGEAAGQGAVTGLVQQELLIAAGGSLGIQHELLARLGGGVEAEQVPIAALNGLLHFLLAVDHAALDGVHLAGGVADDQGRAVVGLGLGNSLDGLVGIGAHSHLGHIDVAVAHSDLGEALLLDLLAGRGELGHLADVGGLGGLAAGVGIDLGVEDEDVDVVAGGEDVIHAAEADIIGPAVAAEDPHGLLGEIRLLAEDLLGLVAAARLKGGHQGFGGGLVGLAVVHGLQPLGARLLHIRGGVLGGDELLDLAGETGTDGVLAQIHAKAVLGVVLKEGVGPGGAVAGGVDGIGGGSGGAAPDGGAAGGVGDVHPIAEELGHETGIAGLGAAGAGAGELQERLAELAALDGVVHHVGLVGHLGHAVVECLLLGKLALLGYHGQSAGGALADADAAAHAVQRRYGHGVLIDALALAGLDVHGTQGGGSGGSLFGGEGVGTDGGVGADIGAVVALDALALVPVGDGDGDAALLVGGRALLELAVHMIHESADREAVAVHAAHGLHDVHDLLHQRVAALELSLHRLVLSVSPVGGHVDLHEGGGAGVDGLVVVGHDVHALLGVGLGGGVLHVLDGLLLGHDLGQGEERGLEDGVGALAHTDLNRQVDGVDGVDLDAVFGDVALGGGVQMVAQLLRRPLAVDEEGAAGLHVADDGIPLGDIAGVVAGHEVGLVDVVGALDGLVAKAQVADGDAAGLLGVILEVGLDVLVGVVADDLDGVLVGAHGAVAAETPELALDGALRRGVGGGLLGQAQVGDVVHDADGELMLGLVLGKLLVDSEDAGGRRILGAQAVTAADDLDAGASGGVQGGDHVQIEGLAQGAGLLGAVQNGQLLAGGRDGRHEPVGGEGTVQANLDNAHLLAVGVHIVDDLVGHVADGAHSHDDPVGVGRAVVVEELVVGAKLFVDLIHVLLDHGGQGLVVLVAGLAVLEEDVAVLVGAAHVGMLGVQRVGAERLHGVHVHHFLQVVVIPDSDLLDLVGGAEAVEEVDEGDASLDGGKMRHGGQIHDLLDGALSQHGKAGLAAGHHVGVVAEDVQGVAGHGAGGNMEDAGEQLTGDLIHVGDHQKEALGGGVCSGKGAGRQRAVHRTGGACLGLHLHYLYGSSENVLLTRGGPLIHVVSHGAGRRDRVDARNLGERVGYPRGRVVAVHGLEFSRHVLLSLY